MLLLGLLAGVPVIATLPNQIGAIRLGGVSVLWWYTGVVAPMLAVLIAAACARRAEAAAPERE